MKKNITIIILITFLIIVFNVSNKPLHADSIKGYKTVQINGNGRLLSFYEKYKERENLNTFFGR